MSEIGRRPPRSTKKPQRKRPNALLLEKFVQAAEDVVALFNASVKLSTLEDYDRELFRTLETTLQPFLRTRDRNG